MGEGTIFELKKELKEVRVQYKIDLYMSLQNIMENSGSNTSFPSLYFSTTFCVSAIWISQTIDISCCIYRVDNRSSAQSSPLIFDVIYIFWVNFAFLKHLSGFLLSIVTSTLRELVKVIYVHYDICHVINGVMHCVQ